MTLYRAGSTDQGLIPLSEESLIPLGGLIVLGADGDPLADFAGAVSCWHRNPWAPVAAPPTRWNQLIALAPPGMPLVRLPADPPSTTSLSALDAVRRRPPPTGAQMTLYLSLRRGPSMEALLARVLGPAGGTDPTRAMRRAGFGRPGHWRGVYRSLVVIATAGVEGHSEEAAAADCGIATQTLSRWCRRFYGLPWREVCDLTVWEAMLETALRHQAGHN